MRIREGEVRVLKTGQDFGLILEDHADYVVMAPGFLAQNHDKISGRYHEVNGVKFSVEFPTTISKVALGEIVSYQGWLRYLKPRIGRGKIKDMKALRSRWQTLSYLDSVEDAASLAAAG